MPFKSFTMPNFTFSPLYTLTDAATNALQTSIALRNNYIWNAYRNKKGTKNNVITPLVGGGAGIAIPDNERGVYIWGYWIKCDEKKLFIPLYVGKSLTNCIQHILRNHLRPNGGEYSCFGTKALFRIPKCDNVDALYDCLNAYNAYNLKNSRAKTIAANMRGFWGTANRDWLSFFHNQAFYACKIPRCIACNPAAGGYHGITNDDQFDTIYKLRNTPPGCVDGNELADEIENSRDYLAAHFCFTYMDIDKAIKSFEPKHPFYPYLGDPATSFEHAVKVALESIGLYTMGRAGGPLPTPVNIDLRNIQNNLVNITGAPYPNPLIITV